MSRVRSKRFFLYRENFDKLKELDEGWISSDETEVLSIDVAWLKRERLQEQGSSALLPATNAEMILMENFGNEWAGFTFIHITTK